MPKLQSASSLTLVEALIATADRQLWERYCRIAAELEDDRTAAPVYALGSLEAQRQLAEPHTRAEQP